ncbi:MAG TPA: hypothetical protein VKY26_13405 [Actinomycetota bacterium]|nr:hypothetical protein [Actinomycetota bacterium]
MDVVMDAVALPLETPKSRTLDRKERPSRAAHAAQGLGRETYASFLLLAVTGFTLAGYLLIALLVVGAVK